MAAPSPLAIKVDGGRYTLDELIKARRPNWSLPQPFYVDETIYRIEMERIFRRGWLFAGYTCQIPRPGDYFLYDIDTESIIVTRGHDNQIRALFNFCRHRGTRLCSESAGHVGKFVCSYHQWVYDLDGKLLKASWMGNNFDPSRFGLHAAHVRELDGLIFINLAETPRSFDDAHEHIGTVIRPHRLDRAKIAHTTSYDVAANWKLVIENQRECLHCQANHPEYLRAYYDFDVDNPQMQEEIDSRIAESCERWAAQGLDVSRVNMSSAYTGTWYRANRTPFRKGYVTESLDGQPLAPLMGDFTDPDVGTARAGTYLNFWIHATSDHAASIQVTPLSPTTTRWTATWVVHENAVEGVDYDLDRLIEFTLIQSKQDWAILDNQGLGVRSFRYREGPYSPVKETNVEKFVQWYLSEMTS